MDHHRAINVFVYSIKKNHCLIVPLHWLCYRDYIISKILFTKSVINISIYITLQDERRVRLDGDVEAVILGRDADDIEEGGLHAGRSRVLSLSARDGRQKRRPNTHRPLRRTVRGR